MRPVECQHACWQETRIFSVSVRATAVRKSTPGETSPAQLRQGGVQLHLSSRPAQRAAPGCAAAQQAPHPNPRGCSSRRRARCWGAQPCLPWVPANALALAHALPRAAAAQVQPSPRAHWGRHSMQRCHNQARSPAPASAQGQQEACLLRAPAAVRAARGAASQRRPCQGVPAAPCARLGPAWHPWALQTTDGWGPATEPGMLHAGPWMSCSGAWPCQPRRGQRACAGAWPLTGSAWRRRSGPPEGLRAGAGESRKSPADLASCCGACTACTAGRLCPSACCAGKVRRQQALAEWCRLVWPVRAAQAAACCALRTPLHTA